MKIFLCVCVYSWTRRNLSLYILHFKAILKASFRSCHFSILCLSYPLFFGWLKLNIEMAQKYIELHCWADLMHRCLLYTVCLKGNVQLYFRGKNFHPKMSCLTLTILQYNAKKWKKWLGWLLGDKLNMTICTITYCKSLFHQQEFITKSTLILKCWNHRMVSNDKASLSLSLSLIFLSWRNFPLNYQFHIFSPNSIRDLMKCSCHCCHYLGLSLKSVIMKAKTQQKRIQKKAETGENKSAFWIKE